MAFAASWLVRLRRNPLLKRGARQAALLLVFFLAGCKNLAPAPPALPVVSAEQAVELPVVAATQAGQTLPFADRLRERILRAARASECAIEHYQQTDHIAATLRLADGRSAQLHLWRSGEQELTASVRVGLAGDARKEQQLLTELGQSLRDPLWPDRRLQFQLPPRDGNG